MSTGPLIILDGDCRAHHYAAILSSCPGVEAYAVGTDYGFLPSFRGRPAKYVSDAEALELVKDAKAAGRCAVQASQSTQLVPIRPSIYTPHVDKVIRFPFLQFYAMAPAVFESKFGFKASPKRILDLDIGTMRVTQEKAESRVDYTGFIADRSRTESLFQMTGHLGGALTAMQFREIAGQIDGLSSSEIDVIFDEVSRSDGMNFGTEHPVDQTVLDELGFNWSLSYERYRAMLVHKQTQNWAELYERRSEYLDEFRHDSQAWHAVALASFYKGDVTSSNDAYKTLLELSPGYISFWFDWFELHLRSDNAGELQAAINQADAFFDGQQLFSYMMSFTELRRGNNEEAEAYAHDYALRSSDRGGSISPLLKVLCSTGRASAARDVAANYCCTANDYQLFALKQNLTLFPEIGLTPEDLDRFSRGS